MLVEKSGSSLRSGWPAHHQAGASHDTMFIGFNDSLVNCMGEAKIAGVNDQILLSLYLKVPNRR
jgi:hypothetical protein